MAAIEEVLRRLRTEPDFRDAVDRDPAGALGDLDLSDDDLARIDGALRAPGASIERFFADEASPPDPTTSPTNPNHPH